ncbi:uncharacterized protein ACHE_10991S [Aspergillus chevalieri]|uniref:Uncharacterized protein n=1 Tax=Aspergillus chevalieri TaxID=182096 RepID=A0A7R7VH02_ASPCH|nr:uncharacterized protein ACHE_10991S [Aspergillus chevalieri]BCR83589.1 hypothetical protein ACHE_10991S [Aspergillus chevalieri]
MESFMFTSAEWQLTTERQLKYQGTAKIDLDQISFRASANTKVDQKNVERLCEIFRKDACHRLDIRNHVTAIVSRQDLRRACQDGGITNEDLMANNTACYPRLQFPTGQVQCLHGQHRLKAAEETLPPTERWWTVNLYLDGLPFASPHPSSYGPDFSTDISPNLRNALVDEYANEKQPNDGEVYRKICQYQHEHNAHFQKRWWSRLSDNKAKRLRQLRSSPDNVDLCAAFDGLLAIPGLWNGMSLGSLNKVMAIKCDEEIIHYLEHIKRFWATLVDYNHVQMAKIDSHTVHTLQLRAPKASKADRNAVKGLILSGEVFTDFKEAERAAIWHKMQSLEACDCIIPSLHTFFRDISYLNACADAVKRLVVLNKKQPTIQQALTHSFQPRQADEDCQIQTSETAFRRQPGTSAERKEAGYRQIWMYAMRWYPEMAKDEQSHTLKAKPTRARADENSIHDMAVLARKLGFRSEHIKNILKQSPDRQIAQAALLKARKPDRYYYDSNVFDSFVDRITDLFSLAIPYENQPIAESVVGRAVKLTDRCGPPSVQAQRLDRSYLFLDKLHSPTSLQQHVSSFYVRRCVYYAFFGKPSISRQHLTTSRRPSSEPSSNHSSSLFVPDDSPHLDSELGAEDPLARSDHRGHPTSRRQLRKARREKRRQRRERRRNRRQENQRAAESNLVRSQESLPQDFPTREDSTMDDAPGMITDTQESPRDSIVPKDLELLPETSGTEQFQLYAEERMVPERTEQEERSSDDGEQGGQEQLTVEEAHAKQGLLEHEAAESTEQNQLTEEAGEMVEQGRPTQETEGEAAVQPNSEVDDEGQSQQEATHDSSITAEDVEKLDGMLQDIVEQEATGSPDLQDCTQLIKEQSKAARRKEKKVDEERAKALARLENEAEHNPLASEGNNTRPVTQLDLPSLIARWRERASHLDDDNSQRPHSRNLRQGQQSRYSKPVGIKTSWVNGRPTLQDINQAGTLAAAITDQLDPDHEDDLPDPVLPTVNAPATVTIGERIEDIQLDRETMNPSVQETHEPDSQEMVPERHNGRATVMGETSNKALKPSQQEQETLNVDRADQEQFQREVDERAAAEAALFEATFDDEYEAEAQSTATDMTHQQLVTPAREESALTGIDAGGESIPPRETPVKAKSAQGTASTRNPDSNIKTIQRHGKLHRPSGIKNTRDKAKRQRHKGNVEPDQVEQNPQRGQMTRASKAVTQIDFSKWVEGNQTTADPQADLPRPKRTRPRNESEEPGHSTLNTTAGTNWVSRNRKRVWPVGPWGRPKRARLNRAEVIPPSPLLPLMTTEGWAASGSPSGMQPGQNITITFRAYEHGEWTKVNSISVEASDPRKAQELAGNYARAEGQNAQFYNHALRKVSVNQCVRAAIDDGTFTILMSLGRELHVTRQVVASVTKLFEDMTDAAVTTDDEIS